MTQQVEAALPMRVTNVFMWAFVFFIVVSGCSSLLAEYIPSLANCSRIFALLAGFIAVVVRNPKVSYLFIIILLLSATLYLSSVSGKMTLFLASCAIVVVKDYSTRKVMNAFAASLVICFAVLSIASAAGFVDATMVKDGRTVLSLGLVHSNTLGMMSFTFLCLVEYYLGSRRRIFAPLLLLYAAVWFGLTLSRTAFFASIAMITICALLGRKGRAVKRPKFLCYVVMVLTAFSIAALLLFVAGNPVAFWLDGLLSGRLTMIQTYNLDVVGVPLVGSYAFSSLMETVDNVYLFILFRYGVIGLLLFNVYYYLFLSKSSLLPDSFLFFYGLLLAVYGVTESTSILNTCLNPTLLLLGTFIPRRSKGSAFSGNRSSNNGVEYSK